MFLKSIHLKNFKKFKDKEVRFPADLTVVKGPNEKGKSTLLEGLIAGLFYDPTKSPTPKYLEKYRAYHSKSLYRVDLNFELDGEDFCLQKDFERKTSLLLSKTADGKEADPQKIRNWLWQKGGYGNELVFQATACVAQAELAAIGRQSKALGQVLEDLITSGQNNVRAQDVLAKIKKAYQALILGLERPAKKPGEIKLTRDQLTQWQSELDQAQTALQQRINYEHQYQAIKLKTKNLKLKLTDQQKLQANLDQYFEAKKNLEKLEPDLDRVSQVLDQLAQIDKEETNIQKLVKQQPAIDEKVIFQFDELSHQKKDYQEDLRKLEQIEPSSSLSQSGLMKNLALLFGGLILPLSLVLTWFVSSWFLIAAGLAGLLVIFWLIRRFTWKQLTKHEKEKKIGQLKDRLESLDREQQKILEQYHLRERAGLVAAASEFKELVAKQDDLKKDRQRLLASRSLADWQKEKQKLARQVAVEYAKISQEFSVHPPGYQDSVRFKRQIKESQDQLSHLEKDLIKLETEINNNPWDQEKINQLAEKLATGKSKQARLIDKKDSLLLLDQVLQQARGQSLKTSLALIEKYMTQYISLITDGRWSQIKINQKDLSLAIFSPDKKEMVSSDELSRGTIDQLYLVARLSFLQAISRAARPLIILDDPFVHTDKNRALKICQLLQTFCRDFQIILLTCHDRYDDWGKVVEI